MMQDIMHSYLSLMCSILTVYVVYCAMCTVLSKRCLPGTYCCRFMGLDFLPLCYVYYRTVKPKSYTDDCDPEQFTNSQLGSYRGAILSDNKNLQMQVCALISY